MKEQIKRELDPNAAHRIYVEALDGDTYGGETFSEVVAAMRESAWGGEQSDGVRGYMKQVAKRVWDWSQRRVRLSTPEMFVRDLEAAGVLRVTERS